MAVTEIQGEKNKGVISFSLNNVYNHGFLQFPARLAEARAQSGRPVWGSARPSLGGGEAAERIKG